MVDIDPTSEKTFPGITEMREALEVSQSKSCALSYLTYVSVYLSQEWEWNYGKSPKFSVTADKLFNFGHLVRETDSLSDVSSSFFPVCFPPLHVVLLSFLPGLVSSTGICFQLSGSFSVLSFYIRPRSESRLY